MSCLCQTHWMLQVCSRYRVSFSMWSHGWRMASHFLGLYFLPPDIPLSIWRILQIRKIFLYFQSKSVLECSFPSKSHFAKVGALTFKFNLFESLLPSNNFVLGDLAHHSWFTVCNLFMANERSMWCHKYILYVTFQIFRLVLIKEMKHLNLFCLSYHSANFFIMINLIYFSMFLFV